MTDKETVRKILRASTEDSNFRKHLEREWMILFPGPDEMQDMMKEHLLDMVCLFAMEGHSGFSANYAMSFIPKILAFEPLSPLTGEDDEWIDHGEGTFQNKRYSKVFKGGRQGEPYVLDAYIWGTRESGYYTNHASHKNVVFPYSPEDPVYMNMEFEDYENKLQEQKDEPGVDGSSGSGEERPTN